jgi:hypothetical protein
MKKPPCIRGLHAFRNGCPQHAWNGDTGCPAWVERDMMQKGGADKIHVAECVDMFMSRMAWDRNGLLEGNQQAVESFRNGMVFTANGQTHPKPDPAVAKMAMELQRFVDRSGVNSIPFTGSKIRRIGDADHS